MTAEGGVVPGRPRISRWFRHLAPPPTPDTRIIGPVVGWRGPGAARIVLGLPHREDDWVECRIEPEGGPPRTRRERARHGVFRVFAFDFLDLGPGQRCRYSFTTAGGELDLDGLLPADLVFRAPGALAAGDSLLLASCHNPYATERGSAELGWTMWPALLDRLESDPGVRCLVLGGDQLYCDDIEDEVLAIHLAGLPALGDDGDPHSLDPLRRRFALQYQLYWGALAYRRVLSRVPSLAMWDDHDITDGWGSRPESLDSEGRIHARWQRYFEVAREAFAAYQASRNPDPLPGVPRGSFSTEVDLGASRLWLLDLRSERNLALKRVWSAEHESAVFASIAAAPAAVRHALVLSPVVAVRTNFVDDQRLSWWSKILFRATEWLERHRDLRVALVPVRWGLGALLVAAVGLDFTAARWPLWSFLALAVIFAIITLPEVILRVPELPNLTDDLEDGLSSDANRPTLARLLRTLFAWKRARPGATVAILAGDIHVGGMSEILESDGQEVNAIPQIVSSPISHAPMPKVALGFTTSTSELEIDASDPSGRRLIARNIFYVSRRNFARIWPDRLGAGGRAGPAVELHLEGHVVPIAMPDRF